MEEMRRLSVILPFICESNLMGRTEVGEENNQIYM